MKVARVALVAFGLLVVGTGGLYAWSLTLPTSWHVEKSRTIAASPADIYALVNSPAEWNGWLAGPDGGKGMTTTSFGPKSGVGAGHTWEGPGTHGRMEITASDAATGIRYAMTMEDSQTPASGSIAWAAEGEMTRVTWIDEGDFAGLPFAGLFVKPMESGLGTHFVSALAELDRLAIQHRMEREAEEKAAAEAEARKAAEAVAADPGELGMDGATP
jgi:uncharacterized protein YndB with AHSA1/START domain